MTAIGNMLNHENHTTSHCHHGHGGQWRQWWPENEPNPQSKMKYQLITQVSSKRFKYIAYAGQELRNRHCRNTPPPTATKAAVTGGGGGDRKVRKIRSLHQQSRKREKLTYMLISDRDHLTADV